MNVKFDVLFEVVFEHQFHKNGIIPELDIQPTPSTHGIFKNYGLLFKKIRKGFLVLYEKDTTNTSEPPLMPITTAEKFSFEINIRNAYFVNYTAIPLDFKRPKFFYFNNLTNNIVNSDLLLNKQNLVGQLDTMVMSSNIFDINQPATNPTSLVTITDHKGINVFSKSIPTQKGKLIYQIDFNKIGSGRYDIQIDGNSFKKLYAHQSLSKKGLFSILEIFISDQVPSAYRFSSAIGAVSKKVYKIKFGRRKTTWKYFIILKNIETDPGLIVSYGPKGPGEEIYPNNMVFNKTQATEQDLIDTYGNDKVFLFESNDELPMYEVPKKHIKLLKPDTDEDSDSEPDVVIGSLPNAQVSAIKTNQTNTKSYSEIIVYV